MSFRNCLLVWLEMWRHLAFRVCWLEFKPCFLHILADLLNGNAIKAFVSRAQSMLPDAEPSTMPLNVPDEEMVELATEEDIQEDLEMRPSSGTFRTADFLN